MSTTAPKDLIARDRANGERTGTVKVPPRRHIVYNAADREQDSLAFLVVERLERLGHVRLVEQRRRVRLGHPQVAALEFVWDGLRDGIGGKEDVRRTGYRMQSTSAVLMCVSQATNQVIEMIEG